MFFLLCHNKTHPYPNDPTHQHTLPTTYTYTTQATPPIHSHQPQHYKIVLPHTTNPNYNLTPSNTNTIAKLTYLAHNNNQHLATHRHQYPPPPNNPHTAYNNRNTPSPRRLPKLTNHSMHPTTQHNKPYPHYPPPPHTQQPSPSTHDPTTNTTTNETKTPKI